MGCSHRGKVVLPAPRRLAECKARAETSLPPLVWGASDQALQKPPDRGLKVSFQMSRTCVFFREPPPQDRWHQGDHVWRTKLRRVIRGPDPIGGIKRVYVNLLKGLDKIGESYVTNIPYSDIRAGDLVGVVGLGGRCLESYDKPNRILAGIAVAAHPQEWPTLFSEYPIARYVVHCDWVKAMYERHYGQRVATWAVGIDTEAWRPTDTPKNVDVLVYDKIRWDRERVQRALLAPLIDVLRLSRLSYKVMRYGSYKPRDYVEALAQARSMLFLCEHETQGLAYQEAMSSGVPILAWDPGQWLDPWRYRYGETYVPATSVPFFDERCGATFVGVPDFPEALGRFMEKVNANQYNPRDYVIEHLTLEKCAKDYLHLLRTYCS